MLPNMEENCQELCVAIFCIFTRLGGKEKKTLSVPEQFNMESKQGRNQHHYNFRLGEELLFISECIRSYNLVQHTLTKRNNFLYNYHDFIALSRTIVGKFLNSDRGRTAAMPPNGSSSSMEHSLTGIIFSKGTKRF